MNKHIFNTVKYLKKYEAYTFEDFTLSDIEDVKDLLEYGLPIEQIAIELDFSIDKVKQIVNSIEKNKEMTTQGCGCCSDCTGEVDCECGCVECEC